jgi:hypothetical protein
VIKLIEGDGVKVKGDTQVHEMSSAVAAVKLHVSATVGGTPERLMAECRIRDEEVFRAVRETHTNTVASSSFGALLRGDKDGTPEEAWARSWSRVCVGIERLEALLQTLAQQFI